MKDILENKWITVVRYSMFGDTFRLKKQNIELEKQNKQLKESALCERCGGGTMANAGGEGKSG